jgi:NAD-dependent dihydropyrimidine dehydrogenase PreA subunit
MATLAVPQESITTQFGPHLSTSTGLKVKRHRMGANHMPAVQNRYFYIDPSRCIGCNSCVQACTECDTHKGYSRRASFSLTQLLGKTGLNTEVMECAHARRRARARSVGIVRRNKARIFSHHFVPLA